MQGPPPAFPFFCCWTRGSFPRFLAGEPPSHELPTTGSRAITSPLGGGARPLPARHPGAPPLSHRCADAAWIPSFLPGSSPIPASGMGYTARDQMLFEIWIKKKNPKPEKNLSRDLKAQNECQFAEKLLLQWAVTKCMRQRSSERVGWGAGSPLHSLRLMGHVPRSRHSRKASSLS